MRGIKAGDLRHPVVLLKPVSVAAGGRRTVTWSEEAHLHAAKTDVSGREFFQAQAYHAEDIVTFTVRWKGGVDATWRLRHGAVLYNIVEVNHLGYMLDYIRLKCRAVSGGGS